MGAWTELESSERAAGAVAAEPALQGLAAVSETMRSLAYKGCVYDALPVHEHQHLLLPDTSSLL